MEVTKAETIATIHAARLPIKHNRFRSSKKETALFRSRYWEGEQFICFLLQRDSYKIAVKGCFTTMHEKPVCQYSKLHKDILIKTSQALS